jgi:formate dehydrogenase (NADP+) beta subunit
VLVARGGDRTTGGPFNRTKKMASKLVNLEWLKANVPCMRACPVKTNAGGYVALIAEGRHEEAYRLAAEPNPLASICGHICSAPCEAVCRRGEIDQPIAIRALKRFVAERYGVYSKRGRQRIVSQLRTLRRDETKDRVAIIGAGPAGLTAAFELTRLGYSVTIFEASPVAGGMLSLGIPEYRLPRYIIQAQVDEILSQGVELRTNSRLGREFSLRDLRSQGYKGVFIAIGAHKSRELRIEGFDLDGVLNGVDFLLNANLNYRVELGQRVIVVGGGNVAVDVARSVVRFENAVPDYSDPEQFLREALDTARQAMRLGAREVKLVCLESREEMPAFYDEIKGAEEEGIILCNRLGPKRILGGAGKVVGLETIDVSSVFDERGRFNPTFKPNTEKQMSADTIVLAIGQQVDLSFISDEDGPEVAPNGLLVVNPETLATSVAGIFAGGDVAFGPRNVISAVADGQRAALSIHRYLRKEGPAQPEQIQIEISPLGGFKLPWDDYDSMPRQPIPALPIDRRIGVAEVELGYTEALAIREARRCLQCWVNTIFEGCEEEGSECILCGGCVDICPEDCIELVSLSRLSCDDEMRQSLKLHLGGSLDAVEGGPEQFAVMIKDEQRCIRCGLCAVRCPVDCITMEAFSSV